MKEKIKNIWTKTKEFVKDHEEGVMLTVYGGYMVLVLGGSLRALRLANVKTKMEIEALQKK